MIYKLEAVLISSLRYFMKLFSSRSAGTTIALPHSTISLVAFVIKKIYIFTKITKLIVEWGW